MKNIPDWLFSKWQEFADILAELLDIPAVLVMYTEDEYMEVFLSSKSENNPYKVGDREKWYGLYCETVIKTQEKLLVPNALKDSDWDKNPDIELGMISYLGLPLNFPDSKPFGTVCVLDNKENGYNKTYEKLLYQFREVVETDIALIYAFDLKAERLNQTIMEQHVALKEKQEKLENTNSELKLTNDELHVTNELLKEAKNKAEESDKLKTAFLQNISHEIRTPMNGIMGFASMLNQSLRDEDKRTYYANLISKNCNQLLSIVTDIVEVSQIQTGQVTANYEVIDVARIINDILIANKPKASAKKLELNVIKPTNKNNIKIVSDKEKLKVVLQNLVSNAIKYSNSGTIDIGYVVVDACIEFYVRDRGEGIPKDKLKVIFESFRQSETSLTRSYGGTGLGLSICKGYVSLLKGDIWVDSTEGEGSVFRIRLPQKPQKENDNKEAAAIKTDLSGNLLCKR